MAESASDSDGEELLLYRNRPEWSDVVPVPQDDGPHPIVKIAYSEQFRDVYDYFRAILKNGEVSDRALSLTADAIKLNPANYTVWHYRRVILKANNSDLRKEQKYVTDIIQKHPKNYQVWYHRQLIVQWLNDPSGELSFTADILSKDSKNYHAWQYRQWIIQTFSLWEDELSYVDTLIEEDVRNNSAWNQRYFVISQHTGLTDQVIDREIKYALDKISCAPNNESPWNYLRGLMAHTSYSEKNVVEEFCRNLYEQQCRSVFLITVLIDICEESLKSNPKDKVSLDNALAHCAELAMQLDTIRASYWTYMGDRLEKTYRAAA